jgi:iron complex outermembrane receptor protein
VKGLKIGVSVFYIGDRVGGWNDTKTVANGVVTRAAKTRMIPVKGYTTLDLTAGYSFKAVSLLAKVSNLTNTLSYNVHENYSINPIAPRQFLATVAYRF